MLGAYSAKDSVGTLTEESDKDLKTHIGEEFVINTCSALDIYNAKQNHGEILVFDLRSRLNYHMCHISHSINLPVDCCDEQFFTKWNSSRDICSTDKVIKNKKKKELFKRRKRYYIYVIAGQKDL